MNFQDNQEVDARVENPGILNKIYIDRQPGVSTVWRLLVSKVFYNSVGQ